MRNWDEFDDDAFVKRVKSILGKQYESGKTLKSLVKYREFLEANLSKPCILTGIEDFQWEEFYVLGPGSKKEYEKLKKANPSYTDMYEFLRFDDEINEYDGLLTLVKRISDRKEFQLPLGELEVVDKNSENFRMVDDYAIWVVNY